jgi:hypothetical protein
LATNPIGKRIVVGFAVASGFAHAVKMTNKSTMSSLGSLLTDLLLRS